MSKSLTYLRKAGPERQAESDRRWQLDDIRTGIKELDEGWGVPHKDVADWLRSWGRKRQRKATRK
jgi:predicted transcriptional regulator